MTEQEAMMIRALTGQQPTRMAGEVVPGPGIWAHHMGFPENLRPRYESGQAGMSLYNPSNLDTSNVIPFPNSNQDLYQNFLNMRK